MGDSLLSYSFEWTEKGLEHYKNIVNPTDCKIADSNLSQVLIQTQIAYTDKYGNRKVYVDTKPLKVSASLNDACSELNPSVVSVECIHRAAAIAQENKFNDARVLLVSTQRFLQRNMTAKDCHKNYLSFIIQAETLDGFMRELQLQQNLTNIKQAKNLD